MHGVSIKYDFHEDVRIWALKFLKEKFDYDFSDKKNTNPALKNILTTLFAILHKQIPPQCYKIEFSQEFVWSQDLGEKKELENIIELLSSGKQVSDYLSNLAITDEIDNKKKPDRMLIKWNIHHLHLAKTPKRTNNLLFLYIEKNTAYLVGIYKHGAWLEHEVIEKIDRNWPKILQPVSLSHQNIPAQTAKLIREKNINAPIYLANGKVCVQPGFIMGDGYSMNDFRSTKIFLNTIDSLNNLVEINKENIINELISNSQLSSHTLRCIPEDFLTQKKPGLYAEETGIYFSFS